MEKNRKAGKVILIGAGPGDPELLTIKAVRYLQKADVVLVDRLVSPQIIEDHVSENAEIISVGKQCGRGASTPQSIINSLMVQHAKKGSLVVRLKGGDVSVFSNVLDELKSLAANSISYEMVPGITAASGAAAFAAIPLTARGHATGVRLLTSYNAGIFSDVQWKELADTDDTLVFYMSTETMGEVVNKLTANKIDPRKLLAVIEQATTPNQSVTVMNLYDYQRHNGRKLASPTLLIIGKVAGLHDEFKWLGTEAAEQEYFEPVTAKLIECHLEEKKFATI